MTDGFRLSLNVDLMFKMIITAALILLFTYECRSQDKRVAISVNYPLKYAKRTVLAGVYQASFPPEFWLYDRTKFQGEKEKILGKIDKGKFICEFDLKYPVYLTPSVSGAASLSPGAVFKGIVSTRYVSGGILIEPGDSIFVGERTKFDEADVKMSIKKGLFDGIPFFNLQKFSGKGVEKLWCIQDIIRYTKLYRYPASLSDTEKVLKWSDSVIQMVLNTVEIYKHTLSAAAISIIKADYLPMLAFDIAEIISNRKGVNGYDSADKKLYWSKLTKWNSLINFRDPFLQYSFSYSNVLQKRAIVEYEMESRNISTVSPKNYSKELYEILDKKLVPGRMKDRTLGMLAGTALKYYGSRDDVMFMINDFILKTDSSNSYRISLLEYVNELKRRISKGSPSFDFALPDTSGRIVKKDDFAGKIVVIDFMYNGCPGCAKMVPWLTQVHDKVQSRNDVVFISVSIDKDRQTWIEGIGKYSVASSIHLNAKESYSHPMIKFYDVTAYPQLIVVDQKGRIIDSNAPRPNKEDGGESLIRIINELTDEGR